MPDPVDPVDPVDQERIEEILDRLEALGIVVGYDETGLLFFKKELQ